MAADIGVLVVHGMGIQQKGFEKKFAAEVDDRLEGLGIARGSVEWGGGFWADVLNSSENDLWERELKSGKLDFKDVRRFVVTALGDAVAYRRVEAGGRNVYVEIHDRILECLRDLRARLGGDRPLVVVAHSLGSVIISDYIWNAQTNNEWSVGKNPFECTQTLCGLVTFGSTLPLFSLALPKIEAIRFPADQVQEPLRSAARWYNYYDKDDVLGWPLKKLSTSYEDVVDEDRVINVGNWLANWNPAAHTQYWEDRSFLKPVAQQIADVVLAARGAGVVAPPHALAGDTVPLPSS